MTTTKAKISNNIIIQSYHTIIPNFTNFYKIWGEIVNPLLNVGLISPKLGDNWSHGITYPSLWQTKQRIERD